MRSLYSSFSILIAAIFIMTGCSKSNIAQNTEVDDMYFTSKDRKALEASTKVYTDENFTDDYEKPLTEEQAEEYSDINYSSKTVNPEYIAKYSSEEINADENLDDEGEYFDETYDDQEVKSTVPDNYYTYNNYSGWPAYSYGNPYSVWNYDPWFYTSPYWYRPYGSRISITFGYSWGSRWNSPYSYYGYDPFWGYNYPGYYGVYYEPWRYRNSWYGYYGYGYGYGSYYGFGNYYCPTYIAPAYFHSDSYKFANRDITRGPRVSRGAALPSNDNNVRQYRGTGNDGRIPDNGSATVRDNSNSNTKSTGARNNYYRRTNNYTDNTANTRTYQRSDTRSNVVTPSNTRRTTPATGYTRSTQSSYRTGNTGNNTRYSSGSSGGSTTRTYRSNTGSSSYNRSSGTPSYRSTSGTRSSGSTRSMSSSGSSSSRSSGGTSTRSSSSGGSRSSSGGSSSRRGN